MVSASVLILCAQSLHAIDVNDVNANLALRRQAMQLFSTGKADEAMLLLNQFRVDFADSRGSAALSEELISETLLLDKGNQHDAAAAAAAAVAAAIRAIPNDGKGVRDLGRVLCDYGLVCELVLKNPTDALKYYQAGLKLSPNHPVASERLAALKQALGAK